MIKTIKIEKKIGFCQKCKHIWEGRIEKIKICPKCKTKLIHDRKKYPIKIKDFKKINKWIENKYQK